MARLLHGKMSLQPVINHKDEGRAGGCSSAGNAAPAIQPSQSVMPPNGHALAKEVPTLASADR